MVIFKELQVSRLNKIAYQGKKNYTHASQKEVNKSVQSAKHHHIADMFS